jgi:DNA polymerase-1
LFHTETTGLDALHAELVGISFSYEKERIFMCRFQKIRGSKALDESLFLFLKMKIENWTMI